MWHPGCRGGCLSRDAEPFAGSDTRSYTQSIVTISPRVRPVGRLLHQTSADWVLPDIIPLLAMALLVANEVIEKTRAATRCD